MGYGEPTRGVRSLPHCVLLAHIPIRLHHQEYGLGRSQSLDLRASWLLDGGLYCEGGLRRPRVVHCRGEGEDRGRGSARQVRLFLGFRSLRRRRMLPPLPPSLPPRFQFSKPDIRTAFSSWSKRILILIGTSVIGSVCRPRLPSLPTWWVSKIW